MIIRADTIDPDRVPKLEDMFQVIEVKRRFIWWIIRLKKVE